MTQLVVPSTGAEVTHQTASAISRWGGSDWIVPASEDIIASDVGLSGAPLNEAEITTSGLDVSIGTFEAFIDGAYVASDDATDAEHTFTLPGNNTRTNLFLGYDYSAEDSFIFGRPAQFSSEDPRMVIGTFDDDGSTITDMHDRRPVGFVDRPGTLVDSIYDSNTDSILGLNTGTIAEPFPVYDIHIYRTSHEVAETYNRIRVNGSASNLYQTTFFDATSGDFSTLNDQGAYAKVAGTIEDASGYGGFANQVLRISSPRIFSTNGRHYPLIETIQKGVGVDIDYLQTGVFENNTEDVHEILVTQGGNATGMIEIYGLGASYRRA